ncbi:MAG: rhomboid family intramembrane serine protease [Eubacteriales bacterium]|nr:rhomboid family intramembrane serine protease [Eubacteriales bacterium]
MEFLRELERFLTRRGYRRMKSDFGIFWGKEEGQEVHIIEIRPETLPGQNRYPLYEQEEMTQKMVNQWMIRFGKRVERLTLMIFRGLPNDDFLEQLTEYPDVWCLDKVNGRLLLFENQRGDFYGIRGDLEVFVTGYREVEEDREKKEWKAVLTPVNTAIAGINLLVFFVLSLMGDVMDAGFMARHGALFWPAVIDGREYYRLLTSTFLHFGLEHLLQNMLLLLLIGSRMERMTGGLRYMVVYMGAGLGASVTSLFFTLARQPQIVSAGASGAIFGVMGGLLWLILKDVLQNRRGRIREIGLSGMIFMIVGTLSYGFTAGGVDNAAHVGGLVVGFILTGIVTLGR